MRGDKAHRSEEDSTSKSIFHFYLTFVHRPRIRELGKGPPDIRSADHISNHGKFYPGVPPGRRREQARRGRRLLWVAWRIAGSPTAEEASQDSGRVWCLQEQEVQGKTELKWSL